MKRRQFLMGAGGAALAIPLLPSLLSRQARAQAMGQPKRMVTMFTEHGGINAQNMWPADQVAGVASTPYGGGHTMHRGALAPTTGGGTTALSPVLSASSGVLTAGLLDKMFLVRGCDVMWYFSHNTGCLGNFGTTTNVDFGVPHMATIDQIMAWSPSFYGAGTSVAKRSMHVGHNSQSGISWTWQNPSTKSGPVFVSPLEYSAHGLFDQIFVPGTTPTPVQNTKTPVVNAVFEHYKQLKDGAFGASARLSKVDRDRLDAYMSHLTEIESKLDVTSTTASCQDAVKPAQDAVQGAPGLGGFGGSQTDPYEFTCQLSTMRDWYQTWNDVIVAAFMCDTSRIATIHADHTFSTACNTNAWHQNVAHEAANDPAKQQIMADAQHYFFENVFLDLVSKLDAIPDAGGGTLLDSGLVWWTQESGIYTHDADSLPIVAAGSAGGFFQTGQYYDYRDRNKPAVLDTWCNCDTGRRPGLAYNQWLGTVLQAMGIPKSEYESGGVGGYGDPKNDYPTTAYPAHVTSNMGELLPHIAT